MGLRGMLAGMLGGKRDDRSSSSSSNSSVGAGPGARSSDTLSDPLRDGLSDPLAAPAAAEPSSTAAPPMVCINSNVATDVDGLKGDQGFGHAWITVQSGDQVDAGYGLWPDAHPGIQEAGLANGAGSDVRQGFGVDATAGDYQHCVPLDADGQQALDEAVAADEAWGEKPTLLPEEFGQLFDNCATWASDTFHEVTGIDVDADSFGLGIDTPAEIGENIRDLESRDERAS